MYRFHPRPFIPAIALVLAAGILFSTGNLFAAEENAPVLRYGFQAGKQYAYEVKIQAETENYDETREGVLTYNVVSAKDAEFVLKPSGNLPPKIKPHPNKFFIPRGFAFPPGFMGLGPEGITFNRRGEKIVSRELTQLPYLLGEMELMVIEEFPAEAKSSWEKQRELHVVERDSGFPGFMFASRFDSGTHTTAKEQINYAVLKKEGNTLEISKKYSLASLPEADKPSRFEMTGEGQFTFDLQEGVIRSLSMKYECRENEPNVIRKYPITLTCHLLSPEELAAHQKKAEEAKEAAVEAAKPKPFEPGERERLLKDLQRSSDANRLREVAERLAHVPADDQLENISKALVLLLDHPDHFVQIAAAKALAVWTTPEAEDALIKTSHVEDVFLRNAAIAALGKSKSAKAAAAVAAQMYRQNSRQEVSKTLKAMGAIAEDATIACLNDRDMWARGEACNVLAEIGGKKSLEALRNFAPKSKGFEEINAKKALSAIERRLATQNEGESQSK